VFEIRHREPHRLSDITDVTTHVVGVQLLHTQSQSYKDTLSFYTQSHSHTRTQYTQSYKDTLSFYTQSHSHTRTQHIQSYKDTIHTVIQGHTANNTAGQKLRIRQT